MLSFIGLGRIELVILLVTAFVFLSTIIALIDILRSQFKEPNDKLIWVLIVLFLNVVGVILYYAIGRKQRVA